MEESITAFSLLSDVAPQQVLEGGGLQPEQLVPRLEACELDIQQNAENVKRFRQLYKELEDANEGTIVKLESELGLLKATIANLATRLTALETNPNANETQRVNVLWGAVQQLEERAKAPPPPPPPPAPETKPKPLPVKSSDTVLPAHIEVAINKPEFIQSVESYPIMHWFRKYIKYKFLHTTRRVQTLPVVQKPRCNVFMEDSMAWSERLEATIEQDESDGN